jgi:hypothetical protein
MDNLVGLVLKSTGKYQADHWYLVVIQEFDDHYLCFDQNFNSEVLNKNEIEDGWKVVPPMEFFNDLEDMIKSFDMARNRWVQEKKGEQILKIEELKE